MGIYLNPGNEAFQESVNSKIYVDKTGLLAFTNSVIETEDKFICVSRPRRFGKSMAVKMLAAYYDRTCDSHALFDGLKIAETEEYEKRMNHSDVICLDISWFRVNAGKAELVVPMLQDAVIREVRERYPDCIAPDEKSLPVALAEVNEQTGARFVIIIDEWDCLFREDKMDKKSQENYIELLRGLFKGGPAQRFISLAYLTGILPIKKYGTQSALNNFKEYTMVRPKVLAEYVGFTEPEVQKLCERYGMDFEEIRRWYDGYCFSGVSSVYSPNSVVEAMNNREFGNYWTETETYEDLKTYIEMDFDGLKRSILTMLGGGKCRVNTRRFQNDLTEINSRDDVLTLLVHLGYLAYDPEKAEETLATDLTAEGFGRNDGNLQNPAKEYADDRSFLFSIRVLTYGFVALITLIAIANSFNTISTNLSLRRRDYAMLRSVGLGEAAFRRMQCYEGLIFGIRSVIYGSILSLLISFCLYRILLGGLDTSFFLPAKALAIGTAGIFAMIFVTMWIAGRKEKKLTIFPFDT